MLMVCALPFVCGPLLHVSAEAATFAGIEAGQCMVRALGLEAGCPGCGLTRSMASTLHGDVLGALRHNLAGPLLLVLAAGGIVVHGDVLRRGSVASWHQRWLHRGHWLLAGIVGAGWLGKMSSRWLLQ